jgi:hypothetical protein
MVTMMDEIFDRNYQAGRSQLNSSLGSTIADFGHAVKDAFEVLVRIEYQSPWTAKTKRARCN